MAIPEGFTRTQLGLPEDDNRRSVERTSTGMWHILTEHDGQSWPATVFSDTLGRVSLYVADQWVSGPEQLAKFGAIGITEAENDAVQALRWAGYEFEDRRRSC